MERIQVERYRSINKNAPKINELGLFMPCMESPEPNRTWLDRENSDDAGR